MKKYIIFFFLFSSVFFAQPNADNYENVYFNQNILTGNYPNFYQQLVLSDFVNVGFLDPAANELSGSISITNNILSVSLSKTWTQATIKIGVIMHLDVYPILPNIDLGPILAYGGASQTGYNARIENNDLIIYSPYTVDNLSTAAPVTLSSFVDNYEFPFLGLNGSGNVSISQNKLSFEYYIQGSFDPNPSPVGVIYTFPEWVYNGPFGTLLDLPNTDLGILKSNGRNTIYKGKIENDELVVYTTETLPPIPSGCSLAFAYDLNTNAAPMWYKDGDHDTYGSPYDTATGTATPPPGYVANNTDCDDANAAVNPTTIWYRDQDSDSYGSGEYATITGCVKPAGYVLRSGDCNDNDTTLSPETIWLKISSNPNIYYPEITSCIQPPGYTHHYSPVGTGPGSLPAECVDSSGHISNPETIWYYDHDTDGYGNNTNTIIGCTKPENYVSNNLDCDDNDISLNPDTVWYQDHDGDTFGSPASTATGCSQPTGYVRNSSDYDDGTEHITNIAPQTFYHDGDYDTFGNPNISVYYSVQPEYYVINNADCDDEDETLNPNTLWYLDYDGDTYGISTTFVQSCLQPTGYVRNLSDYDDGTANITNIPPQFFYHDGDGDTFGNPDSSVYYSVQPANYVANNLDCDDSKGVINPNTIWYRDLDGDGFGSRTVLKSSCLQPSGYLDNSSDYDDATANITNIAPQFFYHDGDGDTFGDPNTSLFYSVQPLEYVTNNSDCNDSDASFSPNTKWYADNDEDDLGDPAVFVQQCTKPGIKYSLNNLDNCPLITGTNPDCSLLFAPSDYNYIITKTYKQPTSSIIEPPSIDGLQTNIMYFDGLGRPIQQIANRQSPSGKDIITHIGYDDSGRQVQEYLPFKSQGSGVVYDENAKDNTVNFYNTEKYENTSNPFSQKDLESSPLNRVLKQAAAGTSWVMGSGHEIKLDYQTNTGDEVKFYKATATWNTGSGLYEIAFSNQGNYAEKQLYKSVTYDENTSASASESAGSTVEFKNKEGQVVLKRTYEAANKHDTYYVYDSYGNLTYVIPPKAEGAINDEVLNGLCYQYKYDYRNRLVEKKLPDKQWEFIIYDKLDRPVATGPALSPFKDDTNAGWLITKYDAYNRPIYTGWNSQTANSATRKSLQDNQNTAAILFENKQTSGTIDGIAVNYTNSIAPTSFKLLSVNYYDDYAYPNAGAVPSVIEGDPVLSNVKGLATGNWTRVPTTASAMLSETNTTFYDIKSRPIRTYTQNHLGGYTYTDSKLDFTGKPVYTISKHKRTTGDIELTIREEFTYSPQDRLLTHTHQINGGVVQLLAANTYDDLGQLTSKNVGNSTGNPLQKIDYNYNIRGWLTEINKTDELQQNTDPVDLFAFKINYDKIETEIPNVKALYNGNISETFWKTGSDNLERSYGYQYDKLNRLTNAIYQKSKLTTESYNENLSYDKNGNIMSLNRNGDVDPEIGTIKIDELIYGYKNYSNQLVRVSDNTFSPSGFNNVNIAGDDYDYDPNGNMISDKNKNITEIQYNQLNLPKKIIFGTGNTIEYIYNAAGQKLEKIVKEGTITTNTNYLEGFQYKDNVLQFFPTAEGYIKNISGALSYVFQYKDHLGNVRLSYAKNPATQVLEIIEEDNYYPFGLKHKGYNDYVVTNNKYKYQGQERQDELGLNWDSFKYRNYDPAIGRFMSLDPLSEDYSYQSPYAFCENTPIAFRELEGLEKVLAIFYHGGPTGGGQPTTVGAAGYTGQYYKNTQSAATANGGEFVGRIIAPGATSASGVQEGLDFFNANYQQGDQVILYGYSYGVDVAVDLAETLNAASVPIDLLVTVDGSDGPLQNVTVNTTIPENVKTNLNVYQTSNSGASSASRVTGSTTGATSNSTSGSNGSGSSNKSKSGSSNSPGSSGGPNKASNSKKTNVVNKDVSGAGVNHGNVQQKASNIINPVINSTVKKK
jgi:RHS repeat-associated protein